jgi:uncharacterized protein YwbE
MKYRPLFIAALTAITVSANPALAEPEPEPSRPVIEAAIDASPGKRLEAARFFRASYPGLVPDIYSHMKADYPNLERGVVDAWLTTWNEHPTGAMDVATKVRKDFGPRIKTMRTEIRAELESSYPDFRNRLAAVLDEHGPRSRYRTFVSEQNPELMGQAQDEVRSKLPGWYPGKLREMWLNAEPGSTPVFDRLRGMVTSNPQLGPKLARTLVTMARQQSPNLGEDVARHFIENRGQLVEALKAEFPGAGDKIVAVIERTDPTLPNEVARFVRTEAAPIRADFRKNLEAELPGLQAKVESTIKQRYPDLQQQMLSILKG